MIPNNLDNSYGTLSEQFYSRLDANVANSLHLIRQNRGLDDDLFIDVKCLTSNEGIGMMSLCTIPSGSNALAAICAGHQLGHHVPGLDNGRALLVGEFVTAEGSRYTYQCTMRAVNS